VAKLPSEEEVDASVAAFAPYFTALGKVAHAWNQLQEELARLFCLVARIDDEIGLAIWHSQTNDRAQRNMLEAAMLTAASDEVWVEKHPKAQQAIRWLLDRANGVGGQRDVAVHAPCSIAIEDGDLQIVPMVFHGNRLAKRLTGKRILDEFRWYETSADLLKAYARAVHVALTDECFPWPDKPQMPAAPRNRAREG
jgi:hypothetical protein